MEKQEVRVPGNQTVEAEVVDTYEHKDTGEVTGTALIEGKRYPVKKFHKDDKYWYLDQGEVIR